MAFGALIASGGTPLSDKLMGLVAEVRVEQYLDQPSAFAIRFADDLCDGDSLVRGCAEIEPPALITIAVAAPGGTRCLVHGRVERVNQQLTIGGPGSWVEIHGRDRLADLDRDIYPRTFPDATVADAVRTLVEGDGSFATEVAETHKVYARTGDQLSKRGTDLEFLVEQARRHAFALWLDVACTADGIATKQTVHFRPSPPRESDRATGVALPVRDVVLAADRGTPVLRATTEGDVCATLTRFAVQVDTNRITRATAAARNDRSGRREPVEGEDRQAPLDRKGRGARAVAGVERSATIGTAGNEDEAKTALDAALSEEAWFVSATASSTLHTLGGLLVPHLVVGVVGVGRPHDGTYHVKQVTHVINAADHYMDAELRRNVAVDETKQEMEKWTRRSC
jgi:hypothetical protein